MSIIAKQHARIRRRILELTDAAKAGGSSVGTSGGGGGLRGRMLADILAELPESPADDRELMGLCQDLVNAGLLSCQDRRSRVHERWGLDYAFYCITASGTALLAESVPPHPLVADERIRQEGK